MRSMAAWSEVPSSTRPSRSSTKLTTYGSPVAPVAIDTPRASSTAGKVGAYRKSALDCASAAAWRA
jgi:hypothetical protein